MCTPVFPARIYAHTETTPAITMQVYDTVLRVETARLHASPEMQQWLSDETSKPSKRWIHDVIHRKREEDNIRLKTDEFILLPDVTPTPKYRLFPWQHPSRPRIPRSCIPTAHESEAWQTPRHQRGECDPRHWLAIVTDLKLRSIRDLRGEHLSMLRALEWQCTEAMLKAHPTLRREDVMIFANYPPSVYQLHFHVCVPFKRQAPYDAFRIHPLHTIINNIEVSGTFYRDSSFKVPVQRNSELCHILSQWDMDNETQFIHESKRNEDKALRNGTPHEGDVCFVLEL